MMALVVDGGEGVVVEAVEGRRGREEKKVLMSFSFPSKLKPMGKWEGFYTTFLEGFWLVSQIKSGYCWIGAL